MNEMEQRARLRNLDDLAKEMDRYEADQFRGRGKQQQPMVAVVEEGQVAKPEDVPEANPKEVGEDGNPAMEAVPQRERPMYMDPKKQDILNNVEADSSEAVRRALMSRGQFGQSRKA